MTANTDPHTPWWKTRVLYQIYPLSFKDSNADGLGDLRGIIEKLPYLADLGIGGVWICPFYDSPLEYDYGYGIANLRAINPLFGAEKDVDEMIAVAHRLGIKIILEWAVTNTSVHGAWFRESKSSRHNAKDDWYLWADEVPNNWVCYSGGSAWHYCAERNQYYLGIFFKEHAELNWRTPAVQAAVLADMEYWLQRGIDGFRLDTVFMYFKDKELRDNPPSHCDPRDLFDREDPIITSKYVDHLIPQYFKQRHIHDQNQPECLDIMRRMRSLCDRYQRDFLLLGEVDVFSDAGAALCGAGMSVANNFKLLRAPRWDAALFRHILAEEKQVLDAFLCVNTFSNHDIGRAISRFAAASEPETEHRARILLALALTLRGVPMIYYGEEIAMRDGTLALADMKDSMSIRYHYLKGDTGLLRDVARTPMQWNDAPEAGFTDGARPWMKIGDCALANVAQQQNEPGSVLHFTRQLIRLRNTAPALQTGAWELLDGVAEQVVAYRRFDTRNEFLVFLNFANEPAPLQLGKHAGSFWREVFPKTTEKSRLPLALEPYQVAIFERV